MPYQRQPNKFNYSGMDLHHPPDLLPEGRCSFLFNLQPDLQAGALTTRPPISLLASTGVGLPAHSITRMNDSVPGAAQPYSRFVGAGTRLYSGPGGVLPLLDSGFSGNPLAMVPYRPPQSPEPWLYTYDALKQRRYKTDGTTNNIGIQAPTGEPLTKRIQPLYKLLGNMEDATAGSWSGINASGGAISGVATGTHVPAATTATVILYDSGTTGMACVAPNATSYGWMTGGSSITIGGEQVFIEEVFVPYSGSTVNAIQYDTGLSGLCTIVPVTALPGLRRNQLLLLNGATYVRVLSVTAAPDGTYSFRCNTGGTTISSGQTIASLPNLRVWTVNNHANGSAITGNAITATLTPSPSNGSMSAVLYGASAGADATKIGSRPIGNEDYLHLGLWFDHPEFVTEVHIMLDVAASGAAFTSDFFYYVMRQGDFQQSTLGGSSPGTLPTIEAQLTAIQNDVASQLSAQLSPDTSQPNYPTPQDPQYSQPDPQQIDTGQSSWIDVMCKIQDLTRAGTDPSVGLQNISNGIGILVYTTGGTVQMQVSGLWVGGGYGPDCNFNTYGNQAPPLQWRYRYRNSMTGAHSTVSPETRSGEILRRQAVSLTCPNSPDPQVDTVDWERRGGTNPDWHYIGSTQTNVPFLDSITEAAAQIADALEVTSYQPWPVTDTPKSGTVVVVGTSVGWASGDRFNVRWIRGTEIILGGNTYTLYAPPQSTTDLQLAQSVPLPSSGTYDFSIPEATIEGNPLYGCWLDKQNNRVLGVGDPLNPGLMYFSNNDNPDGASDAGYIEVSSPSEPLLNGFYAEGANYVFTATSLYRVESTPGSTNVYTSYRLAGLEGLAGPWAFDASRRLLFWWGPDGIYVYQFGATAENLTADSLYPLFPHAGQGGNQGIPGVPVSIAGQTIFPPNYAFPALLRVGYSESFVYVTYLDTNGSIEALVYSLGAKGWRKDEYKPGATLFYLEEGIANPQLLVGGSEGNLYFVDSTATQDAGGAIGWTVLPPVRDVGDTRALKQWGDLMLDYSTLTDTVKFNIDVLWDDLLVAGPTYQAPLLSQRGQEVFDLITPPQYVDLPVIHKNITPFISGLGPVFLYEWQPSYLPLPEDSLGRPTDWQTGGGGGFKWINGVIIHADTYAQAKQFRVEYDNQQIGVTISVNHNGEQRQPYYFPPIYAHELRLVPLDDTPWHDWMDEEWIGNKEPEYGGALAVNWVNGGVSQFKWVNGFKLHFDTFGQDKQVRIEFDGGQVGAVLTIHANGEETLPYYWQPFYGHQIRIVPLDAVPWRFWPDTEWLFNQEPEYGGALAVNWTSGGRVGFKWINGMKLHADTFGQAKQIQVQFDGGQIGPTITINHNGEETLPYYWAPIYTHEVRIVPLDAVPWRYWPDTEWQFNDEPEYGGALAVNWVNAGHPAYKWINGLRLHFDTFGVSKVIQVQFDQGASPVNITINANGEATLPYYFQPVYAHEVRIVPQDSVPWRYWPDSTWLFNDEPEYGGQLAVNWVDGGRPGYKWVNGILLHADTYNQVKRLQIQFDNGSNALEIDVQHNGEATLPYYFAPVYAHQMQILPLDNVTWRYWGDTQWLYNMEPEYGGALAVNWNNGGTTKFKFVQGFRLHADTFGQTKRIQILYDGGIVGPVVTIEHNGEQTIPYSWSPPFKAHLMKIVPLDNVPWRYWNDTAWIFEPEPDPANYWISQPTALGQNGYLHARELYIAFAAGVANAIVSAIVDGKAPVTIAVLPKATSPVKQYYPCPPLKGLYWQLTASGTGLQLYDRDIEFLVKSWGATTAYQRVRPFGDTSGGGGSSGARI